MSKPTIKPAESYFENPKPGDWGWIDCATESLDSADEEHRPIYGPFRHESEAMEHFATSDGWRESHRCTLVQWFRADFSPLDFLPDSDRLHEAFIETFEERYPYLHGADEWETDESNESLTEHISKWLMAHVKIKPRMMWRHVREIK